MVKESIKRIIIAGIVLVAFCFYRCPFYFLFHIKCPGCGMTRAILSFLQLDIRAAFCYHPLFPVVIFSAIYIFFSGKILHREKERNYFFINFFDDVYFEVVFLRCLKDSAFT